MIVSGTWRTHQTDFGSLAHHALTFWNCETTAVNLMVDVNHFVFYNFTKGNVRASQKRNMFPQQIFWGFLNLNFSKSSSSFLAKFVGSANSRNLNFGVVKDPTVPYHVLQVPVLQVWRCTSVEVDFFFEIFSCECRMWMGGLNRLGWWDSLAGWVVFF